MAVKKMRSIKVCEQSGYKYNPTPTIMLKGKWLQELGFEIGSAIDVQNTTVQRHFPQKRALIHGMGEIHPLADLFAFFLCHPELYQFVTASFSHCTELLLS